MYQAYLWRILCKICVNNVDIDFAATLNELLDKYKSVLDQAEPQPTAALNSEISSVRVDAGRSKRGRGLDSSPTLREHDEDREFVKKSSSTDVISEPSKKKKKIIRRQMVDEGTGMGTT